MTTRMLRATCGAALAGVIATSAPLSAAQLCPLVSPAAGTTTVTTAPNSYYPGTGTATAGTKTITIGALNGTTAIGVNDEIMVIQMQDSSINTSDMSAYGGNAATGTGVLSDNTTGEYEYAVVTGVATGTLTIAGNGTGGGLVNTYHTAAATAAKGQQTFQVVRVPRYNNVTLNIGGSAATAWNGASGGIFAIDASGTVTVTGTVAVDGLGFRGGGRLNAAGATGAPDNPPYDYVVGAKAGYDGEKGEGSVGTPELTYNGTAVTDSGSDAGYPVGSAAYGSPGTAAGGGTDADGTANDQNTGGGGGGNGGNGGQGGNNWSPNETGSAAEGAGTPSTAAHIFALGGLGGTAFAPTALARVTMGGGGGAGTINNNTNSPNGASGGEGGGMIFVRAANVSGGTLSANGSAGVLTVNDGAGGGGAGGTIVVTATGTLSGITANANGGAGGTANATNASATEKHGPGGGGGGGVVIASAAVTSSVTGGANGTTTTSAYPFGAQSGSTGVVQTTAKPTSVPGVSSAAECTVDAVSVAKSATANASPGGLIAYSVVMANSGPGRADGATFSDPLPSGVTLSGTATCAAAGGAVCGTVTATTTGGITTLTSTVTTLPVSGSVTFSFNATAATAATYKNTATIAPPSTNSDPDTLTSSASTVVAQGNGLSKTVRNVTTGEATGLTADTGKPGNQLEYTLTFTNNTGQPLTNFAVSDTTPANTTFFSAACTGTLPTAVTACTVTSPAVGATGTVKWTYTGTLNAGQTGTFTLDVLIN